MKKQDQTKALAELGGWKYNSLGRWTPSNLHPLANANHDYKEPDYLTSYDAIIPLIQKQSISLQDGLAASLAVSGNVPNKWFWNATPSQLAEALLRATGKWKE